jgi:hypothetical protein
MPQLTKGARKPLDLIDEAIDQIQLFRTSIYEKATNNPHYVRDKINEMGPLIDQIREQRRQLEMLLERQAPQYEQRLAELERWREEMEGRIVPLRRVAGE